ncbi:MAG: metal-dependent transcriptional regulator [Candidatus Margulisiibacteriota bacterium]
MALKQSAQDYLKAIFSLGKGKRDQLIKVSDISRKLDVSPAAVTEMIKKLETQRYVKNSPYKGVELTTEGFAVGRNMTRHHRLWELFLFQELGVPWDRVHEEAERLEHACSDYLLDRIEEKLGFPQFDPHGNPIPDRKGHIPEIVNERPLSACKPGDRVEVVRVIDLDGGFLIHLEAMGIHLRAQLTVDAVLDFDHTVMCRSEGRTLPLSQRAAEHIFVKPLS